MMLRRVTQQHWLSPGLRRRLAGALSAPSPITFEIPWHGLTYRGRLDSYIDREVYFMGAYEPDVLDVIERLSADRGGVFLDVGANVGHHTLFASRHFSAVHAFEPYPPLATVLREHVEINRLRHVHVHAVGLGDVDDELDYGAPPDDRAGQGGFHVDPALIRHRLPMRRGDGFLTGLGVSRVDVIKIDVEGSERRVLAGLTETLQASRPAVVLEYWHASWPAPVLNALPVDYVTWWLRHLGTRYLLFNRDVAVLSPVAAAPDGSMVMALPREWPVPAGLRFVAA